MNRKDRLIIAGLIAEGAIVCFGVCIAVTCVLFAFYKFASIVLDRLPI